MDTFFLRDGTTDNPAVSGKPNSDIKIRTFTFSVLAKYGSRDFTESDILAGVCSLNGVPPCTAPGRDCFPPSDGEPVIEAFSYILHDQEHYSAKDVAAHDGKPDAAEIARRFAAGEIKPPHWHVVCRARASVSLSKISKVWDLAPHMFQKLTSPDGRPQGGFQFMVAYLTHEFCAEAEDKTLYPRDRVFFASAPSLDLSYDDCLQYVKSYREKKAKPLDRSIRGKARVQFEAKVFKILEDVENGVIPIEALDNREVLASYGLTRADRYSYAADFAKFKARYRDEQAVLARQKCMPVFVLGPSGCGKSTLSDFLLLLASRSVSPGFRKIFKVPGDLTEGLPGRLTDDPFSQYGEEYFVGWDDFRFTPDAVRIFSNIADPLAPGVAASRFHDKKVRAVTLTLSCPYTFEQFQFEAFRLFDRKAELDPLMKRYSDISDVLHVLYTDPQFSALLNLTSQFFRRVGFFLEIIPGSDGFGSRIASYDWDQSLKEFSFVRSYSFPSFLSDFLKDANFYRYLETSQLERWFQAFLEFKTSGFRSSLIDKIEADPALLARFDRIYSEGSGLPTYEIPDKMAALDKYVKDHDLLKLPTESKGGGGGLPDIFQNPESDSRGFSFVQPLVLFSLFCPEPVPSSDPPPFDPLVPEPGFSAIPGPPVVFETLFAPEPEAVVASAPVSVPVDVSVFVPADVPEPSVVDHSARLLSLRSEYLLTPGVSEVVNYWADYFQNRGYCSGGYAPGTFALYRKSPLCMPPDCPVSFSDLDLLLLVLGKLEDDGELEVSHVGLGDVVNVKITGGCPF